MQAVKNQENVSFILIDLCQQLEHVPEVTSTALFIYLLLISFKLFIFIFRVGICHMHTEAIISKHLGDLS